MSERIVYWAGSSIPIAFAAWVGIAAFVYGLRRFGKGLNYLFSRYLLLFG